MTPILIGFGFDPVVCMTADLPFWSGLPVLTWLYLAWLGLTWLGY